MTGDDWNQPPEAVSETPVPSEVMMDTWQVSPRPILSGAQGDWESGVDKVRAGGVHGANPGSDPGTTSTSAREPMVDARRSAYV